MNFEYIISNILEESGISYKTNSRSFILDCPRCGKTAKLYIEKDDGYFICWVCAEVDGFKGPNPSYALHVLTGRPMNELKALFAGSTNPTALPWPGIQDNFGSDSLFEEKAPQPFVISKEMISIESKEAEPGSAYLIDRGIPTAIAVQYGVLYWPRFRRVIFPITVEGVCYGYQARMIDPEAPGDIKVLSSRDLPRRTMVMFHDRLKGSEHAVISEGPIDAIKGHLLGGNVCTMGKHVTPQQIAQIKATGVKKIYFALDRDALPAVPDLARDCGLEAFVIRVPDGREDMGDSTPLEILDQFKAAEPVTGNSLFTYWPEQDPKHKKGS